MQQHASSLSRLAQALTCFILLHAAASAEDNPATRDPATHDRATRRFEFTYAATWQGLTPGRVLHCWLPVPPATAAQNVLTVASQFPGQLQINRETTYGNDIGYFNVTVPASGKVDFSVTYDVARFEVKGLQQRGDARPATDFKRFLSPDRRVPISGRPLELIDSLSLPSETLELGRALYDRVEGHMKYDKSRPGYGHGDSVWACDSRFGNCTDFHSLFISLARAKGLPARFEIGFPLPDARGEGAIDGYHCWACFFTREHGWIPTDISEADKHPELKNYYFGNLTENRVAFSIGRDITLVPKQAGEPLNYFVYPYAEIDETPVDQKHLTKSFSFRDKPVSGEQ